MKKIASVLIFLSSICVLLPALGSHEKAVIACAADLAGKRIGVQAGTTGELYVQEHIKDAQLISFKTGMDAALDLKNGARTGDVTIVADKFARESYAIAVKKGNEQLLSSINKTIQSLKSDGTYEKLVASFMPVDGKITIPLVPLAPAQGKTLKLGTNSAFPPFEYVQGFDVVGFDITMGQYIAKECAASLEVIDMDFDSLIPALASGSIDFIAAGMSVTEERKKNVDFSAPYYESEQVIIVKK